jgi:threonylcarbamoyladenosine tRNA methylthiotransferase MtaB
MSRRCRSGEFRDLVERARRAAPGFNVTTDIIVGFPGETEDEWRQTLDFARQMAFGHIHIFAYSPRAGTKAAGMPDQVSREVKRERSRQLHEVAAAGRRQVLEQAIGGELEVLVEGRAEQDAKGAMSWSGYTPNYLRVELQDDSTVDLENRIVRVRCLAVSDDGERLIATAT